LFVHPFSEKKSTHVRFEMPDNPFAQLVVGYGLADGIAERSNGVGYRIEVRRRNAEVFETLFERAVSQDTWRERRVSLAPYWGDDLEFHLTVDARGDFSYDWLQTTVELVPPSRTVWDLSAHLPWAEVYTLPLTWKGDGFRTVGDKLMVGRSELSVGGESLPGQVHLHPLSSDSDSILGFALDGTEYRCLKVSYALADEALHRTNGVDYTVSLSLDHGETFTDVVKATVVSNTWQFTWVTLPTSKSLEVKLRSSARDDATFDWLQTSLFILPFC